MRAPIFTKRYPGVNHLEAQALVIALRGAGRSGGGGGHVAALRQRLIEARRNQLLVQALPPIGARHAVGEERGQAAG
jgi:hypothetical protein